MPNHFLLHLQNWHIFPKSTANVIPYLKSPYCFLKVKNKKWFIVENVNMCFTSRVYYPIQLTFLCLLNFPERQEIVHSQYLPENSIVHLSKQVLCLAKLKDLLKYSLNYFLRRS